MHGIVFHLVPFFDARHGDVVFLRNAAKALALLHCMDDAVAGFRVDLALHLLVAQVSLLCEVVDAVFKLHKAQGVFHGQA